MFKKTALFWKGGIPKLEPVDIWIFCSYLPLNVSLMVANNSVYVMSWPLWLTCNVDADYSNHEHGIDDEDGGDDNDGGDGGGLQLRVRHTHFGSLVMYGIVVADGYNQEVWLWW